MSVDHRLKMVRALRAALEIAAQRVHALADHWTPWTDCREAECMAAKALLVRE